MKPKFDKSLDRTIAEVALTVPRDDGTTAYELLIRAAKYDGGPLKYYVVKASPSGKWETYAIGRQSPNVLHEFFLQIDNLNAYLEEYAPSDIQAEFKKVVGK